MVNAPLPPCPCADRDHTFNVWHTEPNRWFAECCGEKHAVLVRGETKEGVVSAWRRLAAPFEILRRAKWSPPGIGRSMIYLSKDDALALKKAVEP